MMNTVVVAGVSACVRVMGQFFLLPEEFAEDEGSSLSRYHLALILRIKHELLPPHVASHYFNGLYFNIHLWT